MNVLIQRKNGLLIHVSKAGDHFINLRLAMGLKR